MFIHLLKTSYEHFDVTIYKNCYKNKELEPPSKINFTRSRGLSLMIQHPHEPYNYCYRLNRALKRPHRMVLNAITEAHEERYLRFRLAQPLWRRHGKESVCRTMCFMEIEVVA